MTMWRGLPARGTFAKAAQMMNITVTELLERSAAERPLGERILVRAPSGDDAALMAEVLASNGWEVLPLHDLADLASESDKGAGVLIVATEALNEPDCCATLREILDAQEPWSELPVVLLGAGEPYEEPHVAERLGDRAQLLILERPLGIPTLISAIESALRSRRRQYDVKRLLDELAAAATVVARADRAKDEFLATLAHELRSPITAMRGWIRLLREGALTAAETTEALSMIDASTTVQAHIIEDLMDVSRIVAGKILIEREVIPMMSVVTNVVATFHPGAAAKGLELTADIAKEPMFVFADAARLQ
ncbi:MAG TPA: HAMP domain-containing sensor histidine kinase, partial [Thermoanaerobaculia bacterium]|nr:HAMP domain-containing sensor histidine kinase [Thermoanaerobaculia bacterium]